MNRGIVSLLAYFAVNVTSAAVTVPPEPGDKLTAAVSVNVDQDKHSGLYTYVYTVSNLNQSVQHLSFFAINVSDSTEITNIVAPRDGPVEFTGPKRS